MGSPPSGSAAADMPVRVRGCESGGLLPQIVHIDPIGLDDQQANEDHLQGVQSERGKPSAPPRYPGHVPDLPAPRSVFPERPPPARK